jgi:ribosomal protein L31
VPQEQVAHSTQKTANELDHHCHLAYLGKETILDHAQGTVSEVMSE